MATMEKSLDWKYRCKYPGCGNRYYYPWPEGIVRKHFFKFPSKPEFYQQWQEILKIDPSKVTKNWTICDDHFRERDFVNAGRLKLNYGTVPIAPNESSEIESTTPKKHLPHIEPKSEEHEELCKKRKILIINRELEEHDYCLKNSEISLNSEISDDITTQPVAQENILLKQITQENIMDVMHQHIISRLSEVGELLEKEEERVKILFDLYKDGKFQSIEENLHYLSDEFLSTQFENLAKKQNTASCSEQEKTLALSLYKMNPRLYNYFQLYFHLPTSLTLEKFLTKISYEIGLNTDILNHLKCEVEKMKPADRNCTLLFKEMGLYSGFHYDQQKQYIIGFEDMGFKGRSFKTAESVLVFMIRGIRRQWKQVVAYYFTPDCLGLISLKFLIIEIISQLERIDLNVVGVVCDQNVRNQDVFNNLCAKQNSHYFIIKNQPIAVIYDVPNLLKSTRNEWSKHRIQIDPHKCAIFNYIRAAFNFDQKRNYNSLPKLKKAYFTSAYYSDMTRVQIAAAQLSSSVASAIKTSAKLKFVPSNAIVTAKFVEKIDNMFDSLNGSDPHIPDSKSLRCALSKDSPHLEFWSKLLVEMEQWKILDSKPANTEAYSFIKGWQTTIQSIIFVWNRLKDDGFDYLNLRSFNLDPLENLFCSVRQHGEENNILTCHEFIAALKTVVLNNLVSPKKGTSNCEDDNCIALDLTSYFCTEGKDVPVPPPFETAELDEFSLSYVSNWVLRNINIPDCEECHRMLYSNNMNELLDASEHVMSLVEKIHNCLSIYLKRSGFQKNLEDKFKELFKRNVPFSQDYCTEHNCQELILDKCVPIVIQRFCRGCSKVGDALVAPVFFLIASTTTS